MCNKITKYLISETLQTVTISLIKEAYSISQSSFLVLPFGIHLLNTHVKFCHGCPVGPMFYWKRQMCDGCEREARVHKECMRGPPNLRWRGPDRLSKETAFWLGFQAFVGRAKPKSKNQWSERRQLVSTESSSR